MANFSNSLKDKPKDKNRVGRNVLSRNLWRIADKFKVLPTNEDFQKLTPEQVDWIVINMNIDAKEEARARSGKDPNEIFDDHDTEWLDTPITEFEPVKEGHDAEEIARQVDAMTSNAYLESLEDRFDSMQETLEYLSEHGDEQTIEQFVKENEMKERLKRVYQEAREREAGTFKEEDIAEGVDDMEFKELTNESAQEAIDLFEGNDTATDKWQRED